LDLQGNVTETASSNFVIVKNGALVSPPRENILEGVSLRVVAELAARLNIPITFRTIDLDDCYAADEALLTCTTYCLAGVRDINGRTLAWPGPVFARLLEAWSADVELDIHAQILKLST
jgi:branched-subunit amino acid aminotransferase/4-amino-4-deoxychorismate lyase